jgi:hypothetical protein
VVVKLLARALVSPDLRAGDAVHVIAKLGNFAAFGYCWVADTCVAQYQMK